MSLFWCFLVWHSGHSFSFLFHQFFRGLRFTLKQNMYGIPNNSNSSTVTSKMCMDSLDSFTKICNKNVNKQFDNKTIYLNELV